MLRCIRLYVRRREPTITPRRLYSAISNKVPWTGYESVRPGQALAKPDVGVESTLGSKISACPIIPYHRARSQFTHLTAVKPAMSVRFA